MNEIQLSKNDIVKDNVVFILNEVSKGIPLNEIAESLSLVSYDITRVFYDDSELLRRWDAARQAYGEVLVDKVMKAADDVLNERTPHQAGKVYIETMKWAAAKYAPKLFGEDTVIAEKETKKSTPVTINIMGASSAKKNAVQDSDFEVIQDEDEEAKPSKLKISAPKKPVTKKAQVKRTTIKPKKTVKK